MRIAFRCSASVESVRAYLGELAGGAWECTSPGDPAMGPSDWRLGEATLHQEIREGEGNPRDGYGYDLSMTARLSQGRQISIIGSNHDLSFNALTFELRGFSPSQFVHARTLGCARFERDDTGHPVWARENAREADQAGDRGLARTLLIEGLRPRPPDFTIAAQRDLRRHLIALTEDAGARTALEPPVLGPVTSRQAWRPSLRERRRCRAGDPRWRRGSSRSCGRGRLRRWPCLRRCPRRGPGGRAPAGSG
jgi:hypothetical protein